jgi:phage baseplate assembly protein W
MAEPIRAFRFPLKTDTAGGRLLIETDYEAYVRQLIRQVLLTSPGERVDRPTFGAGLRRLVFSPASETTATLLQTTVFQALDTWLGRLIKVDDVQATFSDGVMNVEVTYTIKARAERRVLNLEVTS